MAMLRKFRWPAAWAAAAVFTWPALSQGPSKPLSAYEKLDESRLATRLKELQMAELLDALPELSDKADDVQRTFLRIQAKIAAAARVEDENARNKLLDEAIASQDELIKLTRNAKTGQELLRHYRYSLDRVVTEGITKTRGTVQRLQYFLARTNDEQAVEKVTKSALGVLDPLMRRMEMTLDDWNREDDKIVTGVLYRLEALIAEARYRGSWVRFHRGMVLPRSGKAEAVTERKLLLHRVIEDLADWANEADNASGVKFDSLLLSGMAARELGEWNNAMSLLRRAADKGAGPVRLKALFEQARCLIEQGKFTQAGTFIEKDFTTIGREAMGAVAADMQASLLRSRLLEAQAGSLKASDPKRAAELEGQSVQVLLDFVAERPEYREAFMEVIGPKLARTDPGKRGPKTEVALGIWYFNKKTPEALAEAAGKFQSVDKKEHEGSKIHATALWYLGVIRNAQRQNLPAASYFRRFAQLYGKTDPRGKNAAMNAVKSIHGYLAEKGLEPHQLDKSFIEDYRDALKVLVDGWGETDPKIRLYYYDLGIQHETLGQVPEAIVAFSKVPSDSELRMHSAYRILDLSVQRALADRGAGYGAQRAALRLVSELQNYRARAGKYLAEAPPARAKLVRAWAAKCHLLEAQLYREILEDPAKAIQAARDAPKQWPEVPDIESISREFIVRVQLESGQTEQAIQELQALRGAEELVAATIAQIRTRIARLEIRTDPRSARELAKYRQAYKAFAARLYKFAEARYRDDPEKDKKMYRFAQALAGAYEFGTKEEAEDALRRYERLHKERPKDGDNIRGIARCYRRLGNHKAAGEQYERLVRGLPEDTEAWWRAQLERLQFFLAAYGSDAEVVDDVLLHIRQLRRFKGWKLGGFRSGFAALEDRAKELVRGRAQRPGRSE